MEKCDVEYNVICGKHEETKDVDDLFFLINRFSPNDMFYERTYIIIILQLLPVPVFICL